VNAALTPSTFAVRDVSKVPGTLRILSGFLLALECAIGVEFP
jgi:hypothetical protein